MIRLLMAVLLLHHIEGVCKPWTRAGLAAKRAFDRFTAAVAGRDVDAVRQQAQDARTAFVAGAEAAGRVPAPEQPRTVVEGITEYVRDIPTIEHRLSSPRPVLDSMPSGESLADQVRRYQRETG